MNINDLKNFQNVAAYKSFSLAAKMLGVPQPTLSESIRRLESQIEQTLFYRSKSGIELTPQGALTLEKTRALLQTADEIRGLQNEKSQQLFKIGCHPVVGRYFLASSLQQLHKSYPNTQVKLVHAHSRAVQTLIQDGRIDIAVVVNPIKNPDLIIKPIAQDKIHLWQADKKEKRSDQVIADMGLAQVQSLLRSWKQAPAKQIDTNDFDLIAKLTLGGMGYGVLPERFVKMEKLKLKKVYEQHHFKDEFAVVYRPEFGKSELEQYIIQSIKSSFSTQ
tara:strand:+ start:195 stop:1022 length:828 start_codon:yes stop_codon:yes gene_type:complete